MEELAIPWQPLNAPLRAGCYASEARLPTPLPARWPGRTDAVIRTANLTIATLATLATPWAKRRRLTPAPWRRLSRTGGRVALTGDAESPQILRQWRHARRARLMNSLDWTRYHLWIYFVDSCEPSYARARLCRFFFEKVCQGRDTATLLYCAAGGMENTQREHMGLEVASAVPDLHPGDLQNLSCPPFTFVPNDFSMYDVTVAVDEATAQRIRQQLPIDRDELCVLSDFVDAYDVLLEAEEEMVAPKSLTPGLLTADGLARLKPGEPLRGTPVPVPVGSPLCGLPEAWEELWSSGERSINAMPGDEPGEDHPFEEAGRIFHSIVGLERCLRASIPPDMRWWNDEV